LFSIEFIRKNGVYEHHSALPHVLNKEKNIKNGDYSLWQIVFYRMFV
jgi:hypothetical protein